MDSFHIIELIGSGSYGYVFIININIEQSFTHNIMTDRQIIHYNNDYSKVYKAISLMTNKLVALKVISIMNTENGVPVEVKYLSKLRECKNIVQLTDHFYTNAHQYYLNHQIAQPSNQQQTTQQPIQQTVQQQQPIQQQQQINKNSVQFLTNNNSNNNNNNSNIVIINSNNNNNNNQSNNNSINLDQSNQTSPSDNNQSPCTEPSSSSSGSSYYSDSSSSPVSSFNSDYSSPLLYTTKRKLIAYQPPLQQQQDYKRSRSYQPLLYHTMIGGTEANPIVDY
ncbi:hypothetical protein PPL_06913 [Heterostelium album PN500]|uniref:Protein kinase domain-containing protein n=1 Tax=Heterostelium pallidum (strain ATCC 26659 / Pp 5 / PN500) TaxID=670386 RepID=D3BDW0_HETP5|nr:hypothetical protein PPL_06913 [Heterostelium album PN500]EFA80091.1 hypothetical protein PPL_06913 [Heterostelium album PN500]|eukprot:XP_020432211.1 hypothetical protein PPL_06913 [Heterostelium album PN500]